MNFIENNLALVLTAIGVIIVERIVKFYVTENLRLGESVPVLGEVVRITRSQNLGGGFGVLQGQNWIFIAAAVVVLGMIIYYYNSIIYDMVLVFASALMLGGTVGNLMDRIFFGHVIDYIDFAFWPTFNLSDVALSAGVVLLIVHMYRWQKEPEKERTYVHY